MWARLKSFFTVALFTILIWFAADLNVSEPTSVTVNIRLKANEPDQFVAFADHAGPMTFVVEMHGLRVHLREFEEMLGSDQVFDASPEFGASSPRKTMLSRDIIRSIREIDSVRLRVRGVNPPNVDIRVDTFVNADMPIEPDIGDLDVSLKPLAMASVRLPSFALEGLADADSVIRPDVKRLIREYTLENPEKSNFRINVPLTLPLDPGLYDITPREITLEGKVESQTGTVAKGPVIVSFLIPDEVQKRFLVEVKEGTELRPDVFVTGPKSQLDQLNPQDIVGLVEIRAAYMAVPGEERSATVRFVLPPELPGLRVAPASQNTIVDFKLVERPRSQLPDQ